MMPYLPFFSSCKGYDSHIPLSTIFATRPGCELPDPSFTSVVSNFDFWAQPYADECDIIIECQFEESLKLSQTTRWFEANHYDTLYYLTQYAHTATEYAAPIQKKFAAIMGTDQVIPVKIQTDKGNDATMKIPRSVNQRKRGLSHTHMLHLHATHIRTHTRTHTHAHTHTHTHTPP